MKPNFLHLILVGLILVATMMFAPLASLGQSATGTPSPTPPVQAISSPVPIYSFVLDYTPNGNIVTAQDSLNGNWSYSYDEFNRLLTASGGGQGQSFDYDAYGNRWHENVTQGMAPSTQFVFDNSNRIIGSGVKYDTLGNVIDDGFHTYTYDAENRLVKVDLKADGSSAASYTYDAFGHRVSKTVPSAATEFLYDLAGRVIAERDTATGAWIRSEVYAGGRHLATYASNTTYFRHSDWLGSSRVKTLPDGTVAETCRNLPFGDGLTCTPGAGQSVLPDLFAGYDRDQETQLDHTWFRKYSSVQGRWTTPDPYLGSMDLANPQSLNRYSYVLNNPVNLRDPLGLDFCEWDDGSMDDAPEDGGATEGECRDGEGTWVHGTPGDSITVSAPYPVLPLLPFWPPFTPVSIGGYGGGGAPGSRMYDHPIGPQKAAVPPPCPIPQGPSRQTPINTSVLYFLMHTPPGDNIPSMRAATPDIPSMRAATPGERDFPWPLDTSSSCTMQCINLYRGNLAECPKLCSPSSGERPEFERESPHIEENRVPFQIRCEQQIQTIWAPTSRGD